MLHRARNLGSLALVLLAGCSSRPPAVKPVAVDAEAASRKAMDAYDTDADGQLGDQELTAVPGIAKYKQLYDQDSDGRVSRSEILSRLQLWEKQGLGFRELNCVLTLDGRPLEGATLRLVPEPYLGDNVKPASGQTDAAGVASMAVAQEDLPPPLAGRNRHGVTGGTYKIEVSHPDRELPARYNTATTLGEEIALDTVRSAAYVQLTGE